MREYPAPGDLRGVLIEPDTSIRPGVGVLVLAGSSGRVPAARARLLASRGATALALGYFGGPSEPETLAEIPLETFVRGLDALQERGAGRLAVMGVSKGAEAALLVAADDQRVELTIGFAPSSVAWQALGARTSSWTRGGVALPYVPYVQGWAPTDPMTPAFVDLYQRSLDLQPVAAAAAAIAVERIAGDLVLVAGGDDQVWPSVRFARDIADRRRAASLSVELIVHPDAGHRCSLPGEPPPAGGLVMRRGGTPQADAELGARAWASILPRLAHAARPPR